MFVLGIKKWKGKGSCSQWSRIPHLFPPITPHLGPAPPLDNKEAEMQVEQNCQGEQGIKETGPALVMCMSIPG